jgi:hypothetical protein
LQHAEELANEVRSTLTQLLHAIGLLNAKVQTEERLAVAQRHIIMALVAVECHLPCSELDMKLHLLLHGPRRILGAGPLGSISMLQWESLWGVLAPYASNKHHPEVSMLRGCCDAERAMLVRERTNGVLGHERQTFASELPPHPWQLGASESAAAAAARGGNVQLGRAGRRANVQLSSALQLALHATLVKFGPAEYGDIWRCYIEAYRTLWSVIASSAHGDAWGRAARVACLVPTEGACCMMCETHVQGLQGCTVQPLPVSQHWPNHAPHAVCSRSGGPTPSSGVT